MQNGAFGSGRELEKYPKIVVVVLDGPCMNSFWLALRCWRTSAGCSVNLYHFQASQLGVPVSAQCSVSDAGPGDDAHPANTQQNETPRKRMPLAVRAGSGAHRAGGMIAKGGFVCTSTVRSIDRVEPPALSAHPIDPAFLCAELLFLQCL